MGGREGEGVGRERKGKGREGNKERERKERVVGIWIKGREMEEIEMRMYGHSKVKSCIFVNSGGGDGSDDPDCRDMVVVIAEWRRELMEEIVW